jgi:hypothetical protein
MSDVEDLLRLYRPVRAPLDVWKRALEDGGPKRSGERGWMRLLLGIAGAGFLGILYLVLARSGPWDSGDYALETRAREALYALEAAAERAGTLQVKFRVKGAMAGTGEPEEFDSSGTVLLKEKNKIHFSLNVRRNGDERESFLISNGETMTNGFFLQEECPEHLSRDFTRRMIRTGIVASRLLRALHEDATDPRRTFDAFEFREEPGEEGSHILSYKLRTGPKEGQVTAVKLWYDPKSLRLIRRIVSNPTRSYTESYDQYELGVEIPDDAFDLSKRK